MKKLEGIKSFIKDIDTANPYGGIDRSITPFWEGGWPKDIRNGESVIARMSRFIKREEEKLAAMTNEEYLQGISPVYLCSAEAYEAIEKGTVVPVEFYTNALGHTVIQYKVKESYEQRKKSRTMSTDSSSTKGRPCP